MKKILNLIEMISGEYKDYMVRKYLTVAELLLELLPELLPALLPVALLPELHNQGSTG
jgi:hypothetical protein